MFGYVTIQERELSREACERYRSYYCGLCRTLYERYGASASLSVSEDGVFLLLFLTGLYTPECELVTKRCLKHCVSGVQISLNEYTKYVADISILLSYYKCRDDWSDERRWDKLAYQALLERSYQRVREQYPEKCERIASLFEKLAVCEKQGEENLDKVSGLFGEILAECFRYRDDEWTQSVCRFAFFLGKFVYLMDAYEDLEQDLKCGTYNPFRFCYQSQDYEMRVQELLDLMMAECIKQFEWLPLGENVDILRNILSFGVWSRYERRE